MSVHVGEFSPKFNILCKVTGKPFGPNKPQKRGYMVQYTEEGLMRSIPVAHREDAYELKEKIEAHQAKKEEE